MFTSTMSTFHKAVLYIIVYQNLSHQSLEEVNNLITKNGVRADSVTKEHIKQHITISN